MNVGTWRSILALSIVCCIICSGCITNSNNGEKAPPTSTVAPTTSPPSTTAPLPSVYIFPKSEHQLQEQITEWSTACDDASAEWKSALGAFRSLAESPESTQDELYLAFSDYDAAILEYERVLIRYYAVLILSEHTEPTESGQLALMKETVPFDRPDGLSYSYEVLNMGAEEYMVHEGGIKLLIRDGITGQERLDAIDRMERYLPRYHDMMVGYVYYEMNEYLTCLSLYSDGLEDIQNCSTPFVM